MLLNKRQLKSSDGELEGVIEEARQELARREHERELEAKRRESQGDVPGGANQGGYQWEMVRCRKSCKCNDGAGHGPYLYRYFRSSKTRRMTSEYIGVNAESHAAAPPRPAVEDARQLKPFEEKEQTQ